MRQEAYMLSYSRMKSIGVQVQGPESRVVSGVLEDELYGMECHVQVSCPDFTITSVQARMKRFTTIRCPRAMKVFARAEGWKFDAALNGKIKKEIGRLGCRHMAVLMVDCCRSVARAEFARELQTAQKNDPNLDKKSFIQDFLIKYPSLSDYLKLQ
jgi:hypothetical protein